MKTDETIFVPRKTSTERRVQRRRERRDWRNEWAV